MKQLLKKINVNFIILFVAIITLGATTYGIHDSRKQSIISYERSEAIKSLKNLQSIIADFVIYFQFTQVCYINSNIDSSIELTINDISNCYNNIMSSDKEMNRLIITNNSLRNFDDAQNTIKQKIFDIKIQKVNLVNMKKIDNILNYLLLVFKDTDVLIRFSGNEDLINNNTVEFHLKQINQYALEVTANILCIQKDMRFRLHKLDWQKNVTRCS